MKNYSKHLPVALLLSYVVYTAFVTINLAHSLITFSLALLAGYHAYLSLQEKHQVQQSSLEQLRDGFDKQLNELKEVYAKKISKLEDETAKLALNHIPPKVAASSPQPRKMVF